MGKTISERHFNNKVIEILHNDFMVEDVLDAIKKTCEHFDIDITNASKYISDDIKIMLEKDQNIRTNDSTLDKLI